MASSTSPSCRPVLVTALAGVGDRYRRRRSPRSLDFVGTLAVEFFVVADRLFVNEIAPRPHNSGHWTLDACDDRSVRPAGPRRVRIAAR